MFLSQFWPEKRDELLHCLQTIDDPWRGSFAASISVEDVHASGPDVDRSGWR